MLSLDGVSKAYGGTAALHPISLAPEPGRTTVLIGPSGCGKSTLLRLMIGLVRPDSGLVRFGETPVTPETALAVRRRMGYVIQEGGLFPHLTARRNVTLLARHLGWDAERCTRRVAELAALVHLPEAQLAKFPGQLSGGQRQRVGLMRALMLDPDVLLLDEPLGALDPMIRAALQDDLRAIFRDLGKTVVLVTHDMGEAAFFADTIVLLRAGRIVQQGTLDDFLDAPAEPFVEAFINAQRSPLAERRVEDG
ncbi:MAG: ABC transporter ATP-binding protein [Rhodothermales bacterium]|nr:ABC transporter ATP-binding protein [Rhodothermales bacterium]